MRVNEGAKWFAPFSGSFAILLSLLSSLSTIQWPWPIWRIGQSQGVSKPMQSFSCRGTRVWTGCHPVLLPFLKHPRRPLPDGSK